jgi:hypothetical protein
MGYLKLEPKIEMNIWYRAGAYSIKQGLIVLSRRLGDITEFQPGGKFHKKVVEIKMFAYACTAKIIGARSLVEVVAAYK